LAVPYEQPEEIIVKKLAVVFILAAVLATGALFADHPKGWGVGVQGGFNSDWGGGFIGRRV